MDNSIFDIVVIGAGPAGMAAATTAATNGARTLLVDDQGSLGGQIHRSIEAMTSEQAEIYSSDPVRGRELTRLFRASGAEYLSGAQVWQVTREREVFYSRDGRSTRVCARQVILATGAIERPFPISGWDLPGVMTAGAAQVLLKSSGLVCDEAVLIGTGPLLLLVASQYLRAGVSIRALLDTTPSSNYVRALPKLPFRLNALTQLGKGLEWYFAIARSSVPWFKAVRNVSVRNDGGGLEVAFQAQGRSQVLKTEHVLLHQGVVPNTQLIRSLGCEHRWSESQLCWTPVVDHWGQTTVEGFAVAGDGASILGGTVASATGAIASLGALERLGLVSRALRDKLARPYRSTVDRERPLRVFLETLFRPAIENRSAPDNATIVCRCERITAGEVRARLAISAVGPNQLKGALRCGMGPCQGRLCDLTLNEIIAQELTRPMQDVGYLRIRPPVLPIPLAEVAGLDFADDSGLIGYSSAPEIASLQAVNRTSKLV